MAEKILEKLLDPIIKSAKFWRTYKGKKVKMVVDSSLQSFDNVTYLDLKRIVIGKAVEIVDFPSSIVLEDGEEITSQTQVSPYRIGAFIPLGKRPGVTDQDRVKFKRRAISLNSIKSIEVLDE